MLKKIFLLFSLLVCTCGEVFGQEDDDVCDPNHPRHERFGCACGPKPDWFDESCSAEEDSRRSLKCLNRLTGIHKILAWNEENFPIYGETTTTMFSLEFRNSPDGHPVGQRRILESLVAGRVFQYLNIRRTIPYPKLPRGAIATKANSDDFLNTLEQEEPFDFKRVQAVAVTSIGNEDKKNQTPKGLKGDTWDYTNLPFPIGAGGYEYYKWRDVCGMYGDCALYRAGGSCSPYIPRGQGNGSNFCGEDAKNLCLLGPYQVPVASREGTSLAAAYIGGVIWAVAYFLKNKYQWNSPMTQLQAAVTSVAIVKSCAIDMGDPGPDNEHGLGRLSVECLNDDSEDGFIDNPLSVIKDELYLVPDESYVKPILGVNIPVQIKVYLEGFLPY